MVSNFVRFDRNDFEMLGEESLWPISDAINAVVNFKFECEGIFETGCWRSQAENERSSLNQKIYKWYKEKEIIFYGKEGKYGKSLDESQFLIFIDELKEFYISEQGCFVVKADFLKLIQNHFEKLDIAELNKWLAGQWKKQKEQRVTDKDIVQAVALTLWDINPEMSQADMIRHRAIQHYAGGKLIERQNTLREWLSDVDPRDSAKKPGRKKERT